VPDPARKWAFYWYDNENNKRGEGLSAQSLLPHAREFLYADTLPRRVFLLLAVGVHILQCLWNADLSAQSAV
jgi:hypothetical protein